MKRFSAVSLLLVATILPAVAQTDSLNLYPPGAIPGAIPVDVPEKQVVNPQDGVVVTSNIQTPRLYVHRPATPNGTGVIICPGGGYYVLAMDHEGHDIADWFTERGVTAFVLKSRLPKDAFMTRKAIRPLQDAQQAIRLVRKNAARWDVRPDRIGIMGFSAGGHLAATAGTHFSRSVGGSADTTVSLRPDFMVLVYPALAPTPGPTGTAPFFTSEPLLGSSPPDSLRAMFTNVLHVSAATPPTFLIHAANDPAVDAGASVRFFLALRRHEVPAELHIYETGGHGFALSNRNEGHVNVWERELEGWLRDNKWIR